MRSHARVVIVGGGCVGVSVLYGLTNNGWEDVVLLERSTLTSGSTWHAAGLLVTFVRSAGISRMMHESIDIYLRVEERLGTSVGLNRVGQLRVANSGERMDEFLSYRSVADAAGVACRILAPDEVQDAHPLLHPNPNIQGGLLVPGDGYVNPSDITMGMAKLARDRGAEIRQGCAARAYDPLPRGGWKVITDGADIACDHLVFATGNYARENARQVGLDLPCIPVVHQYWTTDPVPELLDRRQRGERELPILRDEDYGAYLREDAGKFQFGPYEFEKDLELFAVDGMPENFGTDLLPENFEAVETQWQRAVERVPALGAVGIRANTRGPFQMTPDELPLCGPAPGLDGLWLAEGVPGGIMWGGVLGERLARWIASGDPGIDMSEIDFRRFGNHVSKRWTADIVRQTWGTHMEPHVPGEDRPAARPARTAPSYDLLTSKGAVWTVLNGWEIPRWFAPSRELAVPEHSFRRTRHMDRVAQEVKAVRTAAGLFELTPMTKTIVRGAGAAAWLDWLLANSLPKTGRLALAMALNPGGGVEAEFTVLRRQDDAFYLVSSPTAATQNRDLLNRALPDDGSVVLEDATEAIGILALAGPRSRDILQPLTDNDLSNEAFPWLSAQTGEVGYARDVRLIRVSYAGELGWEIHHPISYNRHLADLLLRAGKRHGLKPFGVEALDSMRMDKSYRAIRRELRPGITALEAGMDRFVKPGEGGFVGREALLSQKEEGLRRRLVVLKLPRCDTSVIADEAVFHDDELAGHVTSGCFSHWFGHDIAFALVRADLAAAGTRFRVGIHNELRDAVATGESPYDPAGARVRM